MNACYLNLFIYLSFLLALQLSLQADTDHSIETPALNDQSTQNAPFFAPLLPLEPQLSLYLSNKNQQQFNLDAQKMVTEQERNVYELEQHTFPWKIVLGAMTLGLLVWIGCQLYQRNKNQKLQEMQQIVWQIEAIERLKNIKKSSKWQSSAYNELFLEMAAFCIDCLDLQFGKKMNFSDLNTLNTIINALPYPLTTDLKSELLSFLTHVYYVKFAEVNSSLKECQEAYHFSEKLMHYFPISSKKVF